MCGFFFEMYSTRLMSLARKCEIVDYSMPTEFYYRKQIVTHINTKQNVLMTVLRISCVNH